MILMFDTCSILLKQVYFVKLLKGEIVKSKIWTKFFGIFFDKINIFFDSFLYLVRDLIVSNLLISCLLNFKILPNQGVFEIKTLIIKRNLP